MTHRAVSKQELWDTLTLLVEGPCDVYRCFVWEMLATGSRVDIPYVRVSAKTL